METLHKVDGFLLFGGFVHGHVNAARRELEIVGIEAVDRDRVGMGFQGGVLGAELGLDLHQTKADAFCPDAIQATGLLGKALVLVNPVRGKANKDVDVVAANGEAVQVANGASRAIDHVTKTALLETNGTSDVDKLRDLEQRLAGKDPDEVALEIQINGRCPRGHREVLAAREVKFFAGCAGTVVLNVQARDRQLEIIGIEAIHRHCVGVGLE